MHQDRRGRAAQVVAAEVLEHLGLKERPTRPRFLVAHPGPDRIALSLQVAQAIRSTKTPAESYLEAHSQDEQVNYARRMGITYLVVLSDDVADGSTVNIIDVSCERQTTVSLALFCEALETLHPTA